MSLNRCLSHAIGISVLFVSSGFAYPIEEIEKMAERDTAIRIEWLDAGSIVEKTAIAREIRVQEQANTRRLQEIVQEWGLPREEDSLDQEFFQLVLRSSDLNFQEEFLEKIKSNEDAWENLIPDLTDRILIRKGMPQRYGTQFTIRGDSATPHPIEDLSQVDLLRERYGMDPLEKETKMMNLFKNAIIRNQYNEIHKLLFSAIHDLPLEIGNILYSASFNPEAKYPVQEGKFLAFETPALAIAYALDQVPEINSELQINSQNGLVKFYFYNNPIISSYLIEKPIYISVFKRGNFRPFVDFREKYLDQVLSAELVETPLEVIESDCVLEELIGTGVKLELYDSNFDLLNVPDIIKLFYVDFLFDSTIENESYGY